MNQYDPMKDNSTSNDENQHVNSSNGETYRATDSQSDGREYVNPDGSYGFVYSRRDHAAEVRSRRYRGALIAVSAVLVTVLLACGSCVGAMVALGVLHRNDESDTLHASAEEIDPSNGLFISDDQTESDSENAKDPVDSNAGDRGHITETVSTESAPESATIHKVPAERADADGDGYADYAYDSNGEVLTSAGADAVSVATVVSRVAASVVEITTETISQTGLIGQYVSSGAGSGVIISSEGFVVTNHHVIDGANTITVRLNDGQEYPATLVGSDAETDVAVLWIDASDRDLTVATLGASYDLVVGEDILAIGNPLGSLGGTVTEGMVSATAREISVDGTDMTLLQVSAPINPGNSGGGLFNLAGELVGIVNAKMSSEEIEGLGFAIPIDTAYQVILELIHHGYVRGRPTLDVTLAEITSWKERYVCVNDQDHEVLQYKDLILAVDGVMIDSIEELTAVIRRKSVGDTVELIVYRDKKQLTLTVTVTEYVPAVAD